MDAEKASRANCGVNWFRTMLIVTVAVASLGSQAPSRAITVSCNGTNGGKCEIHNIIVKFLLNQFMTSCFLQFNYEI